MLNECLYKIRNIKYIKNMGRTKGALNKIKPDYASKFKVIELNKQIQNTPEINDKSSFNWIPYGKDNLYPMHLLDLYHNAVTHHSCVDFLAQAICGQGIDVSEMVENGAEPVANYNDSWNSFFYKLALDYVLFGGFAFQIIKNKDGRTFSYFHQQYSTIRVGKMDENGEIKKAYLSQDWSAVQQYKPVEIDIFNFRDEEEIKSSKPYLFIYFDYNPFDSYYASPAYASALNSIRGEIEMSNYDYNSTLNSFTPSGIVTLNQVSDENERKYILKNIQDTFTGSKNASNIIVTFKNSNEDVPIEFTPIASATENINKFADTNERIVNRIISAHKIPNKSLLGIPMDSTGFSNEGSLLEAAYNLLEKVSVSHMRDKIVTYINKMFQMNGIDTQIVVEPLSFNIQSVTSEEEIKVDDNRNEDVNISEKIDENNEDKKNMTNE